MAVLENERHGVTRTTTKKKSSSLDKCQISNKNIQLFKHFLPSSFNLVSVLKDEPDDLTHLAPTAGDACIPLDEFSDMFDDFMLPENYNTLLNDELNSLDSSSSKLTTSSNCSNSNDPFIVYRDESSDVCQSPNLVSPAGFSKVNIVECT